MNSIMTILWLNGQFIAFCNVIIALIMLSLLCFAAIINLSVPARVISPASRVSIETLLFDTDIGSIQIHNRMSRYDFLYVLVKDHPYESLLPEILWPML